jgi:plasmid stability protein
MKVIHIRNVPDDVYNALKALAAANHRSLPEQLRFIIEREVQLAAGSGMATARAWRTRLAGRKLGDTVTDVRQDRIDS